MQIPDELNRGYGIAPSALEKANSFRPLEKKLLIMLPCYREFDPVTALCIAQLNDRRRVGLMLAYDDAFVAHSRNHCCREFLKTDSEWALWIDSDMIIPCGNAKWLKTHLGWPGLPDEFAGMNAIDRLLSHGKTLVGGLYFGRQPNAAAIYAEAMANKEESDYARGLRSEVKATAWVGFGCCLTHRSVFEDITKRYPFLENQWFSSSEHHLIDAVERAQQVILHNKDEAADILDAAMRRSRVVSGLGSGEDVMLCRRASECGHQAYVDLGLRCGHVGRKVYVGQS